MNDVKENIKMWTLTLELKFPTSIYIYVCISWGKCVTK